MRAPVLLIAVWEPVLVSDFLPPGEAKLARLSDPRVVQVWDPGHLMSDAMREGMRRQPSNIPISRRRTGDSEDGILWDAVAMFGPQASWTDSLPTPDWLNGIVVQVSGELTRRLLDQPADAGTPAQHPMLK